MAASQPLTGMPEIAPLRTNRAPGLEIGYALIDTVPVICLSLSLLHLLLVMSSRGVSGVERW